ncbi:MAG: transporter substrate-binding domain-containing protein [Firmicutes bacterium]|nr:transporter substrate-binding domain-containing protein [Bacillota bacterium]
MTGVSSFRSASDADRVNAFIAAIRTDGTLDEMYERWVVRGEKGMPEIPRPQAPDWYLKVGTTGIVEPYSFYEGTELTGFDIELAYRLAAWLNADVAFTVYDYNSIVAAARTGKVDLIAANLQVTPERAEALRFSDPLYREQTGIVVRAAEASAAGAGTVRWQDYNGKRLGVMVGPLMEDAAAEFFPDSEILLFNGYPDCITALLAGRIDAFLGDEPELKSTHAERPEIDYIHDNITSNNYCFAFRKNDPESAALCEELNAFLAKSWADEPTSALDPTMVDEVQAVIRQLAESGKTMMIVTHEMNFARAIANRVFYMDEGGICEDGTPEQIFEHPQKERTRRFIKKLKLLELAIESRSFDFVALGAEIDRYCQQNNMAPKDKYRIRLAIEELVMQILLPRMPEPQIHVTVEYAAREGKTEVTVRYGGEPFDPRETDNKLSLSVLASTAEAFTYVYDPPAEKGNCMNLRIKTSGQER